MTATDAQSIVLTADQASIVEQLVQQGGFETPEEVVSAALSILTADDAVSQDWMSREVGPVYDEMIAHPDRALSAGEVFDGLRRMHVTRTSMEADV